VGDRGAAFRGLNSQASSKRALRPSSSADRPRLAENYGKLPLSFEANQGQADQQVKFLSRGSGYTLFLTGDEAVLSLRSQKSGIRRQEQEKPPWSRLLGQSQKAGDSAQGTKDKVRGTNDFIRMKLVGTNRAAKVTASDELPGKVNYFIGNDPRNWRTDVPTYTKVKYESLYPGVDLIYYGNQGKLEYDFVVAPGADPSAISLAVGAGLAPPKRARQAVPLRVDTNGDLIVQTGAGEVRFHKPVVYQRESGVRSQESEEEQGAAGNEPRTAGPANRQSAISNRQFLDGHYVLTADNRIHFEIPKYDRTKSLVIDPTLVYSTDLGPTASGAGNAIALDSSGNAYVAGQIPGGGGSSSQAFVMKLNSAGTALIYSTVFAGSADQSAQGIAVDSSGEAIVTGWTTSSDFPTVNAFQSSLNGVQNPFVAKLNAAGNGFVYSTYLDGNEPYGAGTDTGNSLALDSSGNAYVTGATITSNFPVTANALQPAFGGGICSAEFGPDTTGPCADAFVAELSPTGSLLYATYLGGPGYDSGAGIALDASGNIYVTGMASANFPTTAGAFETTTSAVQGGAFVAKINAGGISLGYSSYLSGSNAERGSGIAVDSSGEASVTGLTLSSDFPTTPGAFQTALGPYFNADAFVTKFNTSGSELIFSTYLGGSYDDSGRAIALDASGNIYVTGDTPSCDFPTANPIQAMNDACASGNSRGTNAFVTEFTPTGSMVFSTFLGGSYGIDSGRGVATDSSGNAYVTGAGSPDFPTTPGAYQTSGGGAFVAKIGPGNSPAVAFNPRSLTFPSLTVGTSFVETITLSNPASAPLTLSAVAITGANSGDFAQTNNCGSSVAPGASCTISVTFTPTATGTRSAVVSVTDNAVESPQLAPLSGTGIAPVATLNPTSLTFGNQPVGTTSASQTVTLTNTGSGSLEISNITVTDFWIQANNCIDSLGPGSSCTFKVSFAPTQTGTKSGILLVYDNALSSPQQVNLSGTGVTATGSGPAFVQVQNNLDDYSGTLHTSFSVNITTHTGDLLIAFVRESSNGTDNFTVTDSAGQSWTGGGPQIYVNESTTGPRIGLFCIANSAAVTSVTANYTTSGGVIKPGIIVMEFAGAATSNVVDTMSGSTSGGSTTASYSGPGLTTSNANDVLVFATDTAADQQSWNPGSGYLIPNNSAVTGGGSGSNARMAMQFAFVSSVQTGVHASMTYGNAAWNGNVFAAFKLASSTSSSPIAGVSPSSLTFASQTVGTSSPSQTFTLSNTGTGSLSISSIAITGTNNGDFGQDNNCGTSVAAGAGCTIYVTFTPTASGTRTATFSISDDANSSPQIVSLSGAGVSATGSGPALVQVQNNIDVIATNYYTSFSVPITTTPGNLLVAFCRESSNGTDNFTVSDSAGQTWTQTASGYKNESTSGPRIGMFYVANSAAVTSVTVHYATAGGVIKPGIMVMEISGGVTSGVYDGSVGNNASSTTTSTTAAFGLTTTNPNDILIFATDTSTNQTGWTSGSGAIPSNKVAIGPNGSNARMAMEYQVVSTVQHQVSASMTYSNTAWNGNIFAAFK
jgi:ASPM-SPD-2-Hydin domain-containing protein/beta-propeller repeat-containing protein/centrosomal CEP192-like protein